MKIGIYGGSFNPIHVGHLTVAEEAKERLGLDKLIFVPAGNPYFKDQKEIESFSARELMIRDAIRDMDGFEVSSVECASDKPSYTSETLQFFQAEYPGAKLFLVVGEDAYYQLHKWHDIETIINIATVVYFERNGLFDEFLCDYGQSFIDWQKTDQAARMQSVKLHCNVGLSSSYIRDQIRDGGSFRFLVPDCVYRRVVNDRLYGYGGDDIVVG